MNTMNYIVKSAVNGIAQKLITIELTAGSRVLTIKGEVLISDSNTGGLMDHFDVADWEITHLDGKEYSHSSVYNALSTLHGEDFVIELCTNVDSALIESAASLMTESVKTPQNAPELSTDVSSYVSMDVRISRIDWEAVKCSFEMDFDFTQALEAALEEADLENENDVDINSSYGGRDFSVEVSFNTRALALSMIESMTSSIDSFCNDQGQVIMTDPDTAATSAVTAA